MAERGTYMVERVLSSARARGLSETAATRVGEAVRAAILPRERLGDDHHPQYLHPGRTVLILLEDVGMEEEEALMVGAFLESESPALAVALDQVALRVGSRVAREVGQVPGPNDPELAASLVVVRPEIAQAALAERLDQLRHAHLSADIKWRERVHRQAEEVYLPLARRLDPVLFRRYQWWCRSFPKWHLRGDPE